MPAQRFLSSHAMIYGHFRPRRHLMTAIEYRNARTKAFRIWRQETGLRHVTMPSRRDRVPSS